MAKELKTPIRFCPLPLPYCYPTVLSNYQSLVESIGHKRLAAFSSFDDVLFMYFMADTSIQQLLLLLQLAKALSQNGFAQLRGDGGSGEVEMEEKDR